MASRSQEAAGDEGRVEQERSSTTPPSSPPVEPFQAGSSSPPARKRSHDDMIDSDKAVTDNAPAVVHEDDTRASPSRQVESQTNSTPDVIPITPAKTMGPPTMRATSSQSQKPPQSGQGMKQTQTTEERSVEVDQSKPAAITEPNPSAETSEATSNHERDNTDADAAELSAMGEPQVPIVDFDWNELHIRYHRQLEEFRASERAIFAEFESLCNYFGVWASTIDKHESERSFKRLKTQTAYVQHEEETLEQKRLHYVRVVDAFKSALDLLSA